MVIEIWLSDFHKTSITVMEIYYSKQKPTNIHYRRFKNIKVNKSVYIANCTFC